MRELMWFLFDAWKCIENMIWQISVVILVVILCRFFIKRISKKACYFLWLVVAVRLLCPVMIESDFSIFNFFEKPFLEQTNVATQNQLISDNKESEGNEPTIIESAIIGDSYIDSSTDNISNTNQQIQSTTNKFNNIENNIGTSADVEMTMESNQIWDKAQPILWLSGVIVMLTYGVISYVRLKYKLRYATITKEGYFESDAILSPFVIGIVKPVIYMPLHLNEQERYYILLHEQYHIKRRDYLIKLLAFGLLSFYWFHPLVWVAFYLMSQDMEMSCDEHISKALGIDERKAYSALLLSFAVRKRIPLPAPLSFGENNVKGRIKQILNYKKPTVQALFVAAGLIILVGLTCLTDANNNSKNESGESKDNMSVENKYDEKTGKLTDEYLRELAKELFDVKNPYIGDMPANGKILNYLKDALEVSGTNGTELQTAKEPYWITLSFDEKPDEEAMFYMSSMFLCLVDNATEFCWEYYDEDYGRERVFSVHMLTLNSVFEYPYGDEGIKEYAKSPEKIEELWRLLEQIWEIYKNKGNTDFLIKESNWEYLAASVGFDWTKVNEWKLRFIEDDLLYTMHDEPYGYGVNDIKGCYYDDFDENGQNDLAVLVASNAKEYPFGSRLFFYMNSNVKEAYTYGRKFMLDCRSGELLHGDIDHDGYTEFVFYGNTGGNGGAGSYYKDIFKYKDGFFEEVPWIGDYTPENSYEGEMGFELEVRWGEEMDTYDIVCPTLDVTKNVYSPYLRDENGKLHHKPSPGNVVGGNCRGFHTLAIIEENGKDYLVGTEVVTGDGGTVHCFADARFVFDWDEEKGWIVRDFDVISFDYESEEAAVFDAMKVELEYLPASYEAIVKKRIPLIDYKNNKIVEPYDKLSSFARNRQQYDFDDSITYVVWNEEEEPIYVRLLYVNGVYYYMEDYTRLSKKPQDVIDYMYAIYTNDLYTVQKSASGEYIEYFYLTNEENLSFEELSASLLSSAIPSTYDVIPIYHKALDEEGVTKYMNLTGNILDLGMQISLPRDEHWIQDAEYSVISDSSVENAIAKVKYYDEKIFADMTLLAGKEEDVFKNTDITAYIDKFSAEKWSAQTADNKEIYFVFYNIPIDDTYKMAAALWEYAGNTYLLYGKTSEGNCSSVVETATYVIEHLRITE